MILNPLGGLKISQVASVSQTPLDRISAWYFKKLLTPPPIYGKHRCFEVTHTLEVILMSRITSIGFRASVAGKIAAQAAPQICELYSGGEIKWVVHAELPLVHENCCRVQHARDDRFSQPGDLLEVEISSIIETALARARFVRGVLI